MKFLCPSCKAKYHVADEKMAGRSLRMKCRKCEFVISLSDAPPAPPTLAPAEGELVPRLPGPPAMPKLGVAPPWAPPRLVAQRNFATNAMPAVHGAAAFAVAASAAAEADTHVTPESDELPGVSAEEWFVAIQGAPSGPMRLSELRERAGAGEITLESMVWRDGDDDWKKLSSVPELAAIVEEQLSSVRASAAPARREATPPPLPVGQSAHSAAAASTNDTTFGSERLAPSPRVDQAAEDLAAAGLARPRLPLAAWAALAVAMLLGLTIGFVVFGEQKRSERVAEVASAAPATPPAQSASTGAAEAPQPIAAELPAATPSAKPMTPARAAAAAPPAGGSKGLPAPVTEAGPSGASAPSGPLSSATIEGTVARYKASVKRSCWQPALEARASDAPTSARVNVTLTIAPSGAVESVTTSGDPKGYPGLASCIAGRVRGWQFPPSGSATPVNVPFVFAGQ